MSESPNRRWFQFHLSTAIMLMLIAGALLGLNLFFHKPSPRLCLDDLSEFEMTKSDLAETNLDSRGLPFITTLEYDYTDFRVYARVDNEPYNPPPMPSHYVIWCYRGLAANLLIAAVVLVSTAIGMEYVLRRREASRP